MENEIISIEHKSVQPFRTKNEYMYAMKKDLVNWFNTLYQIGMTEENFFQALETGVVLCKHANELRKYIIKVADSPDAFIPWSRLKKLPIVSLPDNNLKYRENVERKSFQARDNVTNFIQFCRDLGINDVVLFETNDLVERNKEHSERLVILCLLEVARRGSKFGMLAPKLIEFEEEIDRELEDSDEDENDNNLAQNENNNDIDSYYESESNNSIEYLEKDLNEPVIEQPKQQSRRKKADLRGLDEIVSIKKIIEKDNIKNKKKQ
ncbi:unnamed protein product [Dimorphilus gyrociliatus]|uniref:Calponin-homology (CH) domain-containing protein n=1 Tax=Dimorphilus gyrociliatus TaxID=2664684 RepID=A0A7I8W273_9ANNE|nr:unnamed protein product [Dimorphilus gyrociliatus]